MTCATLKRHLDWEMAQQLLAKRRRCVARPGAATASSCSPSALSLPSASTFAETAQGAKLTPEIMEQNICDEIKRLQRRRQLRVTESGPAAAASSSSESEDDAPSHHSHAEPNRIYRRAIFTFKQVRIICERMLHEQNAALRAEYEAALSGKLAEQYEAFVRFNQDQIQRLPPPLMHNDMETEQRMQQDPPCSYLC